MEILYQDQDIVVVVKPRGVLSEDAAGQDSVPTRLSPLTGRVFAVHRLDRPVGGVMVYARTQQAAAALSAAVQRGELHKIYTAVVTGSPDEPEGEWRDMLYHDARQNKTFVVKGERKGAKEAALRYSVLSQKTHNGVDFSQISVELLTGRSHQIRVQCGSRALPLVGDGKYGSRVKALYPALYATSLSFPHPKTGKEMHFSAPVPADFPWDLFGSSHYEIERKFLIAYPDEAVLRAAEGCRTKRLVQTYLKAPEGETRRVRAVEEGDTVRYIQTVKKRITMLRAVEEEKVLSEVEYKAALRDADPTRRPIQKTRFCIPFGGKLLEIDLYDFWRDRATLEVELVTEAEAFTLPPYVKVLREVTDDKRYKNVNLAKELPNDPL
jgi:23S rRNA pseudouridine1911/1915/1917 synthase